MTISKQTNKNIRNTKKYKIRHQLSDKENCYNFTNVCNCFDQTKKKFKTKKFSENFSIIDYRDSAGAKRIPRCSTGFDKNIPGYFDTNFSKTIKKISELYGKYDIKLFEYFDSDFLDLVETLKDEDEKYLNLFNNVK